MRVDRAAFRRLGVALALSGCVSGAMAGIPRDLVFDCPCSAEWVANDSDRREGVGSLVLRAGIVSHRATESDEVYLRAEEVRLRGRGVRPPIYGSATVGHLAARDRKLGDWTMPSLRFDTVFRVILYEIIAKSGHRLYTQDHESLALWPVPSGDGAGPIRFVDILTDSDGDGVGDVNERLAGTSPEDPGSTPGDSVIDVLLRYTPEFRDAVADYPYTHLLHHMSVVGAIFEDSGTGIELRIVGMSEEEELLNDRSEERLDSLDAHGADISVWFEPTLGASGLGSFGASGSSHWTDASAIVGHRASAFVTAHELGHVMGLAHSARQGETHGAWLWSRGHHFTPAGHALGTVMAYGAKYLGGVFSNPAADCGGVPCGVAAGELDGADSVKTLDLLRFQIAARRAPATDTDGDGFVDATDSFPDDPGDWFDADMDDIGDNADPDDDNDGVPDVDDPFPLDPEEPNSEEDTDDQQGLSDLSPFRDPGLRSAVEAALSKEAGAPITAEDMARLTVLQAGRLKIRDLTGLELATELKILSLVDNRIHDLRRCRA